MAGLRPLALCALLVIAGCAGPLGPGGGVPTDGATGSPSATPTETATATPLPPQNPWRTAEVVVGVDGSANPDRRFVPLVERAVAYWNGPGRANATYDVTFRVDADAPDPDLVVVVRSRVTCADHADVLGCAPVLRATDRPPRPVVVDVAAGFTDETTLTTLKHEFGHVLGIRHGEPPLPLMAPRHAARTLPQTDAVDKPNPWTTDELRIHADFTGAAGDVDTLRFQLERAVAYYDDGAEGHVPANVSFALVADPARADIVVAFDRDLAWCPTTSPRSCGSPVGYDPDGDGVLEYYVNATVVLNGIDDDAAAWHVGYWLGVLMGHDRLEERAPPFRNATADERRSDWWD